MKLHFLIALAALLATARADDLEQIIANASKGQSAQTTAQVREYAESHRDEISGITQGYRDYLSQIEAMTDNGAAAVTSGTDVAVQPVKNTPTVAVKQGGTGLQTASLEPSTGLTTSHLAGYPALPDVAPVSSISNPTAAQLQQGAEVQEAMQARKRVLMNTPMPYP